MPIKTMSVETAKLLKKAGFPQDKASFYSVDFGDKRNKDYPGYIPHWTIVDVECASARRNNTKNDKWPDEQIAMPITDELLEELPEYIKIRNNIHAYLRIELMPSGRRFRVQYMRKSDYGNLITDRLPVNPEVDESLPEALAQMWLYLKKEGLLNAER